MRLSGIIFIFFLAFIMLPAHAQDNSKIRVINEDGSVSEVDLPGWGVAPPEESKKSSRKVKENPVEESSVAEEEAPAAAPAPPARKSAETQKKQEPAEKAPPIPEYVEKKKRPATPVAAVAPVSKAPPVPGRKPAPMTPEEIAAVPPPSLDDVIHQNEAVGIALKYAPPSKDFRVLRRLQDGLPVYAVLFKTETGVHEVIVDAFSGSVLEK